MKNRGISGPMIFATEDLLKPDVPKGARLLVTENKTAIDENSYYVFHKDNGCKGFDIAIVELLVDGTYHYIYNNKKLEIRSYLSGLELSGQMWEAQTMVEIAAGGTVKDSKLVPPKNSNKKFKVWLPFWTTV